MKHLFYLQLIILAALIVLSSKPVNHSYTAKDVDSITDTIQLNEYYSGYLDTLFVESTRLDKPKRNKIDHVSMEWYMFPQKSYDLPVSSWDAKDIILFTNILFRESGMLKDDRRWLIDKYFVAICAYRTYLEMTNKKIVVGSKFVGTFGMEPYTKRKFNHSWDEEAWNVCNEIVKNVLSNNIPSFVPYLPQGTFSYARIEHCTNLRWVRKLQNPDLFTKVAHCVTGHQYFCYLQYNPQMHIDSLYNTPLQ